MQIVGKGAKNRTTARRTASEKNAGKMDGQSPRVFSLKIATVCTKRADGKRGRCYAKRTDRQSAIHSVTRVRISATVLDMSGLLSPVRAFSHYLNAWEGYLLIGIADMSL